MADRNPSIVPAPLTDEGRITVEQGHQIVYRVYGSGTRTLLGLHGGPGVSSRYLTRLSEVLGDDMRLVLYDQLGSGESDWPDDQTLWQIPRFIAEVETTLGACFGRLGRRPEAEALLLASHQVWRDARHLVMRAMVLAQPDTDAIKRIASEVSAAYRVAAFDRFDEFAGRGGEVGNHHLPAAPEFPHRAREHDGAVVHPAFAQVLRAAELRKQFALAPPQVKRLA